MLTPMIGNEKNSVIEGLSGSALKSKHYNRRALLIVTDQFDYLYSLAFSLLIQPEEWSEKWHNHYRVSYVNGLLG